MEINSERAAKMKEVAEHLVKAAEALEDEEWDDVRVALEESTRCVRILQLIDKEEERL